MPAVFGGGGTLVIAESGFSVRVGPGSSREWWFSGMPVLGSKHAAALHCQAVKPIFHHRGSRLVYPIQRDNQQAILARNLL